MNNEKMKSLGWNPRIDLMESYKRLIGSLIIENKK
jgi:hypothetical protein